jgi:hypothetical protein
MNDFKYYVYFHYKLDTGRLFYIGKGSGYRAWVKNRRNTWWKRTVNRHGLAVEIVQDSLTETEALRLEQDLIQLYKKMGYRLTNLDEGGKICHHQSKTNDIKIRISQKLNGHDTSYETRQKISNALKRRYMENPELKQKCAEHARKSKGHAGRSHSEAVKLKLSKRHPAFINIHTGEIIQSGFNLTQMCRIYGLQNSNIYKVINGKIKQHRGWKLLEHVNV